MSGETERNITSDVIKRMRELLGDKADECILPDWVIRKMEEHQKLVWLKRPKTIEMKDEGLGFKLFPNLGLPDHRFAVGFGGGDFGSTAMPNPDRDLTIPPDQAIQEIQNRMAKE